MQPLITSSPTCVRWQRGTTRIRPWLLQQSIVISCPPVHSSKPTAAGLPLWDHAGTDRRTDRRTPYRFIDPAPPTVRAVPTIQLQLPLRFKIPVCREKLDWATRCAGISPRLCVALFLCRQLAFSPYRLNMHQSATTVHAMFMTVVQRSSTELFAKYLPGAPVCCVLTDSRRSGLVFAYC